MLHSLNKFHLFPIYKDEASLGRSGGFFYSPLTSGIPFQFSFSSPGTISNFYTVDVDTGTETAQDTALIDSVTTDGGLTFFSYDGSALTTALSPGQRYQYKIVTSFGLTFYSHQVCASALFDSAVPDLALACAGIFGGGSEFTLTASNLTGRGWSIKVVDNNNAGATTYYTANPAVFTTDDITADGGSYDLTITLETSYTDPNGLTKTYSKSWNFTPTEADPCAASLSAVSGGVVQLDDPNAAILTVDNTNDIQNLGIYYAGGWQQKLYLKAHYTEHQPVELGETTQNGEGKEFFQSVRYLHRVGLEFWPCPFQVLANLNTLNSHDTITLNSAGIGNTTIERVEANIKEVEGEEIPGCTLNLEYSGAFVNSCQDDYTLV